MFGRINVAFCDRNFLPFSVHTALNFIKGFMSPRLRLFTRTAHKATALLVRAGDVSVGLVGTLLRKISNCLLFSFTISNGLDIEWPLLVRYPLRACLEL